MNLVAEIMLMSALSANTSWKCTMMELSVHTRAPAAWATSAMALMSQISIRGLVGDSTSTSFTSPDPQARSTAARTVMSTLVTLMPCLGSTCASSRDVPP